MTALNLNIDKKRINVKYYDYEVNANYGDRNGRIQLYIIHNLPNTSIFINLFEFSFRL